MKIWTFKETDIETGEVSHEIFFEYSGPVARCDRPLTQQAEQAGKTAATTGANLTAAGTGIESGLVPRLEQYSAGNAPGIGTIGLGEEETGALQTAGAATGAAQERARLTSMRTGNRAGLGAVETASAGEGARASGSALQSILAKNAALKSEQQQRATTGLIDLTGQNINAGVRAEGLVPEDVNAAANAEKVGWLQDMTGLIEAGAKDAEAIAKLKGS